jgi:hypothetical protein
MADLKIVVFIAPPDVAKLQGGTFVFFALEPTSRVFPTRTIRRLDFRYPNRSFCMWGPKLDP